MKNQIFGEAVKVTDSVLINDEMDGILGMGGSPSVFTSVFFNMISQGLISKPIFSYYLSRHVYNFMYDPFVVWTVIFSYDHNHVMHFVFQ